MKRQYFTLSSILLGSTLLLATGVPAYSNPQPDNDRGNQKKYYDRNRKDYHDWDNREDQAYRRWLEEERHEKFREFSKLRRADQSKYWEWRHEHPDNDRR